jgi:hypothetical protein
VCDASVYFHGTYKVHAKYTVSLDLQSKVNRFILVRSSYFFLFPFSPACPGAGNAQLRVHFLFLFLFHFLVQVQATPNTEFLLRASYLEIYNEEVRDLLAKDSTRRLDKRESVVYWYSIQ